MALIILTMVPSLSQYLPDVLTCKLQDFWIFPFCSLLHFTSHCINMGKCIQWIPWLLSDGSLQARLTSSLPLNSAFHITSGRGQNINTLFLHSKALVMYHPVSHGLLTCMNPHQHHLYHPHSCQLHGLQSCTRLPLTSLTTQKLFLSSLLPQIITQSSRLVEAVVLTPVQIFPCL
jgi:hypothetical protein